MSLRTKSAGTRHSARFGCHDLCCERQQPAICSRSPSASHGHFRGRSESNSGPPNVGRVIPERSLPRRSQLSRFNLLKVAGGPQSDHLFPLRPFLFVYPPRDVLRCRGWLQSQRGCARRRYWAALQSGRTRTRCRCHVLPTTLARRLADTALGRLMRSR
jgi:hypothetical protein